LGLTPSKLDNSFKADCRAFSFPFLSGCGLEAERSWANDSALPQSSLFNLNFQKNQIGEKTMFDNSNPYALRKDDSEGIPRYFISFHDSQGIQRETEISRPVYRAFKTFVKYENKLTRRDERHMERFEQTDEMLQAKMVNPPKSLEDEVFDCQRNERLKLAIQQLPEIQRRRFTLYHEFGLTYEQISEIEGCSRQSAARSVERAEEKVRTEINKFEK